MREKPIWHSWRTGPTSSGSAGDGARTWLDGADSAGGYDGGGDVDAAAGLAALVGAALSVGAALGALPVDADVGDPITTGGRPLMVPYVSPCVGSCALRTPGRSVASARGAIVVLDRYDRGLAKLEPPTGAGAAAGAGAVADLRAGAGTGTGTGTG